MSILDDAIREHLELKRAHGADDAEVKRLEDEAFGPPQRPDQADPFAEAPTEFLLSPTEGAAAVPEIGDEAARSGRRPDIADLQEAPPPGPAFFDAEQAEAEASPVPTDAAPPAPVEDELAPAPDAPPPSPSDAADAPLPPPPGEAPPVDVAPPAPTNAAPPVEDAAVPPAVEPSAQAEAPAAPEDAAVPPADIESPPAVEPPAEPEAAGPAAEHQIVPDAGPSTEERHAIADQPTQMFDVQAHVDAEADVEAPAPAEQESPSDEQLVDAAQGEPQAAPPAPEDPAAAGPPTEIHEIPAQEPLDTRGPDAEVVGHPPTEEESTEYDFFNEQRLSDELDQALEAPLPPTDEHIAMPRYEDAPPPPAQGAIFDFESSGSYEEDPSEEVLRRADAREEAAAEPPLAEPPSEELEPASEEYEQPSEEAPSAAAEPPSEEVPYFDPDTGHEDVLEDKPQFLEDPDDDDLWFEQKPPKDFDLD